MKKIFFLFAGMLFATFLYAQNVGIGTTTPTNILSLGNASAQKIWIENTASGTVGRDLTVAAGSTVTGGTNLAGGSNIIQAGLGTGTGASTISFQTGTTLTTGTTLQTMSTKMTILGDGNVGIGTTTPTAKLEIGGTSGTDGIRFPDNSLQKFASRLINSYFAITSTTIQDITSIDPVTITGLSITLTPKSATSKFLIMAVVNGTLSHVASTVVFRNGVNILSHGGNSNEPGSLATTYDRAASTEWMRQHFVNYMDAPATAAEITYSIRHTAGWAGTAYSTQVNGRGWASDMATPSTLTILEFEQ